MINRTVFRFAPSPNGLLHLGHAYSALLNMRMAREAGATMLLRIEDIDTQRCTPALQAQMLRDLEWIGFEWDDEPKRQSEHFDVYRDYADILETEGLLYPSQLSRADIARIVKGSEEAGDSWPRDPDGAPLFPGKDYEGTFNPDLPFALRLNMAKAVDHAGSDLYWQESGAGPDGQTGMIAGETAAWGDVVVVRKDTPTSYHLAAIVDDGLDGVSHVVRGVDLFHATSVHVLLQKLFGFAQPQYHHHGLIMADDIRKLSKSAGDVSLKALREAGLQPADIKRMIGLR